MGNWNFKALLKNRSAVVGAVAGLTLGAGVAAAAITGLGAHGLGSGSYDGATLIKTQNLTPVAPPAGAPMSFADLIDHVSPAVVSIECKGKMKVSTSGIPNIPGFPFSDQDDGGAKEQDFRSAGSGFFISPDGYVVTNNHVIENATEIKVVLSNDTKLDATVIGRDAATDLVVLKVDGKNFPYVEFETDHKPRVGDWVIAMGNPFNFSNSATAGIVSAFGRDLKDSGADYIDYIQIDAAINSGNSGGPTFDMYGRVIGVNTAIVSPSGANAGLGFAIPADVAKRITTQLMKGMTIERGYIGVQIQPVSEDIAESLNIKDTTGAYVNDVTPGGPSEKAGIQVGDIIKSVNGNDVKDPTDLTRRIADVKVGEKVNLTILRNGKLVPAVLTAALRPSEDDLNKLRSGKGGSDNGSGSSSSSAGPSVLGLSVSPVTPDTRRTFGLDATVTGVVITDIDDNSKAADIGLKPGDVIVRADNRPVSSQADLASIVAEFTKASRPSILLLINRDGRNIPLPFPLKDKDAK